MGSDRMSPGRKGPSREAAHAERVVWQRTIEADRCRILDRDHIGHRPWNAIHAAGSGRACRASDRAEPIAEMNRLRWMIEMFFRTSEQLLGGGHPSSDRHDGAGIQAYGAMIVCMPILIYTGEKPNRAMCHTGHT